MYISAFHVCCLFLCCSRCCPNCIQTQWFCSFFINVWHSVAAELPLLFCINCLLVWFMTRQSEGPPRHAKFHATSIHDYRIAVMVLLISPWDLIANPEGGQLNEILCVLPLWGGSNWPSLFASILVLVIVVPVHVLPGIIHETWLCSVCVRRLQQWPWVQHNIGSSWHEYIKREKEKDCFCLDSRLFHTGSVWTCGLAWLLTQKRAIHWLKKSFS